MTASSTTTETSLKGQPLILARVLWLVLVLMTLGLYGYNLVEELNILRATEAGMFGRWFVDIIWLLLMPLGYLAMALLLFWRRSTDGMAILTSIALALLGPYLLSGVNNFIAAIPALMIPNLILITAGIAGFSLLLFLFPDGKFVPGWAKWPLIVMIAVTVILEAGDSQAGAADTFNYGYPLIVIMLGGLAAQVYRYRKVSTPSQRQQTKWVLLGFIGPIFSVILYFALYPIYPDMYSGNGVASYIMMPLNLLLTLTLPVSLALATLRYRLWDIDYVINRTLVYALMTAVLGVVFALGFFALRALLSAILGSQQAVLAAVVPTALVVWLFNPVRRRVRAFVDERLYGIHVHYATPPGPSPASNGMRTSLGEYHDLQPIGSGGMADVYKSTHPTLGHSVAVKVLPSRLAQQEEFRRRFRREAQTVAVLRHPNIVQMFDFGEADGVPYMVMQYVDGISLSDYLKARGPLSLEETQRIINDVGRALDYAHTQGLVHRDVKPSNVMLEAGTGDVQHAVLMDFGIAKIADAASQLTNTGVVGTFDYMAPEQIQAASNVDGRADIYALGVMAYQMLTGETPFKGTNPAALLLAHLNQPAPDPRKVRPDLPSDVAYTLMKALEKDPARRFATASSFASALEVD